ncbi:VOC family protein [Catenuloplanes indicus]|uniref:Enzyme related to lactoylglutathione lyase n=1 Tax=Catenuloplanes indicus TaxID=137267 RepID=A0AAE3W6F8_9ACTN|nr:VOC family protein [Catenuloplanes indicus]MDQ0370783.1 putative enzyme related to lactoylglutathione lyase [Catenuloplanes indicus]
MPLASLKDICIDASDGDRTAGFWQLALHAQRTPHRTHPQFWWLTPGIGDAPVVWINDVPEAPPPVKTRVHLDLRLGTGETIAPLVAAGATVLLEPRPDEKWWLMRDPEGNEFCVFPPDGRPPRLYELVVDARDGAAQARWWRTVLGGDVEESGDFAAVTDGAGQTFENFVFRNVPEPKTVKNRLHWDVTLTDAAPDALVAAGATVLRAPDDENRWWIMADPEGNEFCAFPAGT